MGISHILLGTKRELASRSNLCKDVVGFGSIGSPSSFCHFHPSCPQTRFVLAASDCRACFSLANFCVDQICLLSFGWTTLVFESAFFFWYIFCLSLMAASDCRVLLWSNALD